MQNRAAASLDQAAPVAVNGGELLAILDPLIEFRECFPLVRQASKAFNCFRFGVGIPGMSLFFQLIVLARQRRRLRRGLLLGGEHLPIQRAQGEPRPGLFDQRRRGAGVCAFEGLRSLILYRFMFLAGPFQSGMRVAALPSQVLLRVVEFILIERELRLGEVQQVGIVRIRLLGQLRDAALIPSYLILQLIHAHDEIAQRPCGGRTIRRGLTKRAGESLIQLVVGETQGLPRGTLLVSGFSQRGHLIGGSQESRVDGDRLLAGRGFPGHSGAIACIARYIHSDQARQQQHGQGRRRHSVEPSHSLSEEDTTRGCILQK